MRSRTRTVFRIVFAVFSLALLIGMIALPDSHGPTLHRTEILSRTGMTTPYAYRAGRDMPASALLSVAEPAPKEEKDPPVEGDILALMYHALTENEAETSPWTTTPDKFRTDLTALLDAGYAPLSIEDYARGNFRPGQDYFVTTFDDGYTTNLTLALPILEELGIPATVFVITGSIAEDGHMTWDELAEISASGTVSIYSHTNTHMKANAATTDAFLEDEHTAWALIEERLSPAMKALAYPHGAYTRETMAALSAEGYEVFAVQDVPWWYKAGNEDGICILMRYNVAYESDILSIMRENRRRAGLISHEEATARREARAEEDYLESLAMHEKWVAYAKSLLDAEKAQTVYTK